MNLKFKVNTNTLAIFRAFIDLKEQAFSIFDR